MTLSCIGDIPSLPLVALCRWLADKTKVSGRVGGESCRCVESRKSKDTMGAASGCALKTCCPTKSGPSLPPKTAWSCRRRQCQSSATPLPVQSTSTAYANTADDAESESSKHVSVSVSVLLSLSISVEPLRCRLSIVHCPLSSRLSILRPQWSSVFRRLLPFPHPPYSHNPHCRSKHKVCFVLLVAFASICILGAA